MASRPPAFAIKTPPQAFQPGEEYVARERVMYGGKTVQPGDRLFIFASDQHGGAGLAARGQVKEVAHIGGIVWRIGFNVDKLAKAPLGRRELKTVTSALKTAGAPEIAFKFYRQATDKTIGLTQDTALWLDGFF